MSKSWCTRFYTNLLLSLLKPDPREEPSRTLFPMIPSSSPTTETRPSGENSERGEKKLLRVVLAWYLLVSHASLVIALAMTMMFYLDGKVFNANERYSDGKTLLRVSDITTILSAIFVIIRTVATSWSAISTWRCAFVLLENDGLNLKQFNTMLAYRIPTTNKGKNSFLVIAVLLLMWPAIFVEPLAAGAIDWETFIVPVFNGTRYGSSCSGEKKSWSEWTSDIANRHIYLGKASQEYIGLSQVEAEEFGPEYLCQRYIYTTDHWPLNSVIRDINLPCIAISEISWDTTPPLGVVQDLLLNSTNLSLSTDIPLFSKELVAKTTVILNLENWRDDTEAPPSLLFMGSKKVAVHLGFSVDLDSCHKLGSDRFGPSFPSSSAFFIPWTIMERGSEAHACFLIGTLNITAGVYQAPESILIAHKVVQATPTSVDQIQADIAVTPAFFMMPDLMTTITDQNLTRINAWGNIDHYIREIVSYSYFSSWDAMDGIFCDESEAFQFDVGIAVNMLTASVSKLRVSAWLAINLLFTLSGFVLLVIERKSESTRVVIDPAVAAILVDSSHVLQGGHNTADFSYTTKKDKGLGVLRLEKHENKHRFVRNEDGQ